MAVGIKIINGDFSLNEAGTIDVLNPAEKCSRDISKFLITSSEYFGNEVDFYRYNPDYGTELDNKILFSGLSRLAIKDSAIILLNQAITNYISLQENRNNLDLAEVITGITLDAFFNNDDKTQLIIDIKYTTMASNEEQSPGQFIQTVA
jgi:hypothetical protein